MQSKAADVKTYIAEVQAKRQAAIKKLRSLCRQNLIGYEECIAYGMPCYKRNGVAEVGFASQKQYIALYVMKAAVVEHFRGKLGASSIGKGCIRFTNPDKIDFEMLRELLRMNVKSKSAPC